ncbi:MAG: hypothetical protein ACI97B_003476 [Verrucomicrobiales bacterium]|jgi:hypothetical protein
MSNLKENVSEMIRRMPDDASLEDMQYHLYVLEKLQRGQADIRDGKGVCHKEAKERLAKWLTK